MVRKRKMSVVRFIPADDWKRIGAGLLVAATAYLGHDNGDKLSDIKTLMERNTHRLDAIEARVFKTDFQPDESLVRPNRKGGEK